ncbi:MAG: sulfite exporter TauE/SafE family protein [Acidobacteriota bacterium]
MSALLGTVFLASLAGSLHCAGMCGGLVVFYSGTDATKGVQRLIAHGVYNAGRLIGYLLLGAAAGAIGGVINLAGSLAGLQRIAMPIAGTMMILWGLGAIAQIRGVKLFGPSSGSGRFSQMVRRSFAVVARRPPAVRAAAVGLLSALLPCGWLWAFVITAAGTASIQGGLAVMAAFWAGTVPILLAIGFGAQAMALPFRRHAPMVTAILLVVIGVVAVVRRPETTTSILSKIQNKGVSAEERIKNLDSGEMPCCEEEPGEESPTAVPEDRQ